MLQDQYLPQWHVRSVHESIMTTDAATLYPLVQALDFRTSRLIRCLFRLRGLPVPQSMNLQGLRNSRFCLLEEVAGKELILGLVGKFWTPKGDLLHIKPDEFTGQQFPAYAKATWSFSIAPLSKGVLKLRTETRVFCADWKKRLLFRIYWFFVGPFSGLIRREILRCIELQVKNAAKRNVS